METATYTVYGFNYEGTPVDLSSFFNTPGIADISRQNISWQFVESDEDTIIWSGNVTSDGTLVNTGSSVYNGPGSCNFYLTLNVIFNPDPSKNCCDGGDGDSDGSSDDDSDSSGQQSCPASDTSGDSVEFATGRFVFQKKLLSLVGLGSGGWSFGLNYKSNYGIDGILGKGFSYPQFMHLESLVTLGTLSFPNALLITNTLSTAVFINEINPFRPQEGNNNTRATLFVKNAVTTDEEYALHAANGTVTTFFGFNYELYGIYFPAPGQIKSIVDRFGNRQDLTWGNTSSFVDESGNTVYNGVPQLLTVTDNFGRTVNYDYYGEEGGYRVKQITDYLGRRLNFQYDEHDHLIAVVTPSILKAAPGNTFPGGTAYVFQYDVENADPLRRDDLIKIWYPNQTQLYLDPETRTVDVEAVYAQATPRYRVTYGQNSNDPNTYGKVLTETLGDPSNEVGGTATFAYTTADLPTNLIDGSDPIVSRTIYGDRNGNRTIYDFNARWAVSRLEADLNRNKNSLELAELAADDLPGFVTWTKYNNRNQPLVVVYPEGNSVEYTYDDGEIDLDFPSYSARQGLLLSESRLPGNSISVPHRDGSNGQTVLTKSYFYDPIFTRLCAMIEERGNPIDGTSTYFTPQNGGTTPTNADRTRYTTFYTFDYQKNQLSTITGNTALQEYLNLDADEIALIFTYVNNQLNAGGLPDFPIDLGDINGDGTGDGDSSGLPAAPILGNLVKIIRPSVLLTDGTTQERVELFTRNLRGQMTTATDSEGNITVKTRYPEYDPEGNGLGVSDTLSAQQYGLVREIHQDVNPDEVMVLVGSSGDLLDFIPGLITRTNTPGVYQHLVTRFEGSSGCPGCSYDPMGKVLSQTDPRGFTTTYDRNELGEIYRVTAPAPYNFRVETSYDANRNVIQIDTEDLVVQYNSPDPTAAGYGTFSPSGSGTTAHVPMIPGAGGALRPGWFSNLMRYDIFNRKIEEDIDATGSLPSNLVTQFSYDPNGNLIRITKPEGNTVEYDYDERNLKIAERVGYDAATNQPGAVTVYSYDGNKNLINIINPVDHFAGVVDAATSLTAHIIHAFGSGLMLTHTGDWILQNTYDGFDRVVKTTDALGNVNILAYDPTSALVQKQSNGPTSGIVPIIDRTGSRNVSLANSILRFDEATRLYENQEDVFLPAGYPLPSTRTVTHIGGGLAANSTANDHTGTATLTAGDSSYVLNRTIYDRASRVAAILADNTTQTSYAYDGASRQTLATDPLGNTIATQFDGNGNAVQITRTEVCTITSPAVGNEVFISFTWFDSLNRPVVAGSQGADGKLTTDLGLCCPWQGLPSTLFSLLGYDSRGNRVTTTDPKVNVLVSVYDGASRLIETQQEMRLNGDGRAAPAANQTFLTAGGGIIRTEFIYDGNSRLIELVDDRGASTLYAYDLLDRQTTKTLADGSTSTKVYDAASCLTGSTDENGSTFVFNYDPLARKLAVSIGRASGVIGTTGQDFEYDGLSRTTKAADNSELNYNYDSLSRVIEEALDNDGSACFTTHTQWTSLAATQITYPTTDIIVTNVYDALYRRISLSGASTAHGSLDTVAWEFFGPNRIVETNYGGGSLIATQMNDTRTHSAVQSGVPLPDWGDQYSNFLGYDGVGRMITKRYLTGGINGTSHAYNDNTSFVGFTTAFDRASNKRFERHLHAEERSHLYQLFNSDGSLGLGYDSANRLRQYQRGYLDGGTIPYRVPAGASLDDTIYLPGAEQSRTYDLDGLGNWKRTNYTEVTDVEGDTSDIAEMRQHNHVNEIMSVRATTDGTPVTTPFAYDHGNNTDGIKGNGNLVNDGVRIYQWDAFNRLIQIMDAATNTVIATYGYDALNRRITKTISAGGLTGDIPDGTTLYAYDDQQIIEERSASAPTVWTKVNFWGSYIDELMFFTVPTATTYRVLSDLLYRSAAIVTTSNVITEAYDTDAYGNTLCYSGPGDDETWFTDDDVLTNSPINPTIFTGRQYDPESQIYYYRARYYSPEIGRFISRDPILDAELTQSINLFAYVNCNPTNTMDFSGNGWTTPAMFAFDKVADLLQKNCPADNSCKTECLACCALTSISAVAALSAAYLDAAAECAGLALIPFAGEIGAGICLAAITGAYLYWGRDIVIKEGECKSQCAQLPCC